MQSDPVAACFGAIIRRYRLERGFTLRVAARRAGISVSCLGFLERDPGDLVREVARRPVARRSAE